MKYFYILAIVIMVFSNTVFSQDETSEKDYVIGVYDNLKVRILVENVPIELLSSGNSGKFKDEMIVSQDGNVEFYLIGNVKCSGITVGELYEILTKKYSKYFKDPSISLSISRKSNYYVYVLGQVQNPGIYYVDKVSDILYILTQEKKLLESAKLDKIELRRDGKTQIINFDRILNYGEMTQNEKVHPGDTIFVPKAENIYVYGEVASPGQYYKTTDSFKLINALEIAGKWTTDALIRKTIVFRKDKKTGEVKKYFVDLEKLTKNGDIRYDVDLNDGDIIYVPRNDRPDWGAMGGVVSGLSGAYNAFKGWK